MTLYGLIAQTPRARLARLAATEDTPRPMTVKQRKAATNRYMAFLETLLACEPEKEGTYVLVTAPYYDSGTWAEEAALVEAAAFHTALGHMGDKKMLAEEELTHMDRAALDAYLKELESFLPPTVDYAFLPWEDVLAAEVALPFWYGSGATGHILSSAIRTMAYAGFTKAQREENKKRLLALMEERGEIKRLPAEETEKRQQQIRALFPAPPEEEQEEMARVMTMDTILSRQAEYEMYRTLTQSV